jgi:broad specificity phosphatase PhoE
MHSLIVKFAVIFLLLAMAANAGEREDAFTLYLVRHAEKENTKDDPQLNKTGRERAADLARMLVDAGIEAAWSSDYARTRQTAAPLANALGLEIQLYDPRKLQDFAEALAARAETALVVGHSNTTPELAGLLGGESHGETDDATEFDRLYVLTLIDGEVVSSALLRYSVK